MSKLNELDSSLHNYFTQVNEFRDLSKVSRGIQLLGSWLITKDFQNRGNNTESIINKNGGNFLWWWK